MGKRSQCLFSGVALTGQPGQMDVARRNMDETAQTKQTRRNKKDEIKQMEETTMEKVMDLQHSGKLYNPMDEECLREQQKCMELLYEYNSTRPSEQEKRQELMRQMFAEVGEGCVIEPPLRANWGGHFVHLGKNVYFNFNVTLVDDTHIYIGDNVMIGPQTVIAVACHPEDPRLRNEGLQYNRPVVIGENVWIGSGAIILPGVTIGKNSIIGAGSVVTRDIPEHVVAVGNPCRVIRNIKDQA